MHLAAAHVFPVKSLLGFSAASIGVDHRGLAGDRRFLVVFASSGEFLTQRAFPAMTQLTARLTPEGSVNLQHVAGSSCAVPLPPVSAPTRQVRIWRDAVVGTDCGDLAAAFLSSHLQAEVRLVHAGRDYQRPFPHGGGDHSSAPDTLGFADAAPVLVTSEASLDALNERLTQRGLSPVTMDRFRPNLVLRNCPAFAEDALTGFRIGGVSFRSAGPCARCAIITTDQATGERTPEILSTLAEFRRDARQPSHVNFGIHAVVTSAAGLCSVGDAVIRFD